MKTFEEVQAAHDRLVSILLEDVPNPFEDDPLAWKLLQSATDVLCWVLDHEHNQHFTENLRLIDEFLAECGLELQRKL